MSDKPLRVWLFTSWHTNGDGDAPTVMVADSAESLVNLLYQSIAPDHVGLSAGDVEMFCEEARQELQDLHHAHYYWTDEAGMHIMLTRESIVRASRTGWHALELEAPTPTSPRALPPRGSFWFSLSWWGACLLRAGMASFASVVPLLLVMLATSLPPGWEGIWLLGMAGGLLGAFVLDNTHVVYAPRDGARVS